MDPEAEDPQPDLTPHPLAPAPEDDGLADPAVAILVGYLGRARDDALVRVYVDLSFSGYYELLAADVTSTSSVDPADEMSPTAVHLRASAEVSFVRVTRLSGSASFVSGAIRSRYRPRRPPRGRFVPAIYTAVDHCPSYPDNACLPPSLNPCLTNIACPSSFTCESVDVCSIDFDCESLALVVCGPR
jgi:hypothetical protein